MNACAFNFIDTFAPKAYRRPITSEERDFLVDIYEAAEMAYPDEKDSNPLPSGYLLEWRMLGLRDILAVMLTAPEFLYHVEVGDENGNLTPFELANRLSYHFWNSMPDQELFDAALDGSLMTTEGYKTQVERLYQDPRTKRAVEEFFNDFFRVQDTPNITKIRESTAWLNYHALEISPDINVDTIGLTLKQELPNLGIWYSHTQPGTYEDLFRSNQNFLPDDWWSQKTYKLSSGWDGVSEPELFTEPQRAGLLTRMAILSASSVNHRPIRKGLYVREALLCEVVPPPENCDVVRTPELSPGMTVREVVEEITEQPGTSCASCHGDLINGFGYATEHFSAVGTYREKEPVFANADLKELKPEDQWLAIDTAASTLFGGEMVSFDGAKELTDLLMSSDQLEDCFAQQYFRFALERLELNSDQEAIQALSEMLHEGNTLDTVFKAIAFTPQFKAFNKKNPDVTP